ncbi:L,D-transpeptidase catalytic domain [Caloramator quimbayensis]|uniref:L,D-transpeptidase catalytic domain n=1 Tax=Caloramator quimbayensis TaxID=1147123 RepID=A0A1T4WVR0_9CLOT|nr:L,D-transpeptidase [Caloramator quimbayensis]SKA81443.1 L,D-transpeptidase catalytic domain [Caloramator quimbayensis]
MISKICRQTIRSSKVIYILALIMMIFFYNSKEVLAESENKDNTSIESKNESTEDNSQSFYIMKKLSMDSDVIITSEGLESAPYKIMVSIADQKVYILKIEDDDIKLEKTMICSTGKDKTPTPTGTFKLPPDNSRNVGKWYYFSEFKVYAQYYRRIYKGFLFHSVLFSKPDPKALISSSVKNLGNKASHGCIRLSVEDAKWMYENIKGGTTVEIVSYSLKDINKM